MEATDKSGYKPLLLAAMRGEVKAVELLIKKGANKEAAFGDGRTPLHIASFFNRLEVVQLLLSKGANIEAKDKVSCICIVINC